MRNFALLLLVTLVVGCSSVSTYKRQSIDLSQRPAVYLQIKNDTEKLAPDLARRIEKLGFRTTTDRSAAAYVANVEYTTFFDVVHQTFNDFEIEFFDAKTNESRLRSVFRGRVGFHGIKGALDAVFKDMAKRLDVQP